MLRCPLFLASLASLPLPGQRLPDPVDNRREIHVHDARGVLQAIDPEQDAPGAAEAVKMQRHGRLEDVAEFARAFIEPPLADPSDLQPIGSDLLVMRGEPRQQASLVEILRALSGTKGKTVHVECVLMSVPQAAFTANVAPVLGWKEPAPDADGAAQLTLDGLQADRLRTTLQRIEGTTELRKPPLELLPAQEGTVELAQDVYYAKDFSIETVGKEVKAWPITGKLLDGMILSVRAATVGRDTLGVRMQAVHTEVKRPIPTFETALGLDRKLTIELPETTARRCVSVRRIKSGELLVVVSGAAGDARRWLLLVQADSRR